MTFVTLHELQITTGLSDQAMLHLLKQRETACKVDPDKGIMIDADSVSTKSMIQALLERSTSLLASEKDVLVARFSHTIGAQIEELIEEALHRLSLQQGSNSPEEVSS